MEDKTFLLLEKMYSEINNRFDSMQEDIKQVKKDVLHVRNQVTAIEDKHGKKLDALFDGYKQLAEGQEKIKSQLTELSSKVEKQDIQITVLKGSKKAAK